MESVSVCYINRKCSIPLGGSLKVLPKSVQYILCYVSALKCQPNLMGKVVLPPYCSPDIHLTVIRYILIEMD